MSRDWGESTRTRVRSRTVSMGLMGGRLHGLNNSMDRRRLRPAVRCLARISMVGGGRMSLGASQDRGRGGGSSSDPRFRKMMARWLQRGPRR